MELHIYSFFSFFIFIVWVCHRCIDIIPFPHSPPPLLSSTCILEPFAKLEQAGVLEVPKACLISGLCFADGLELQRRPHEPCPGFCRDQGGTKTQCHLAFSETSERSLSPLSSHMFGSPHARSQAHVSLLQNGPCEPSVWPIHLWFP